MVGCRAQESGGLCRGSMPSRCEAEFQQRLEELRAAQARKPTFIDRLEKAGL